MPITPGLIYLKMAFELKDLTLLNRDDYSLWLTCVHDITEGNN